MPTTDYTEFLHNVKQEYITNSYELDGIFILQIFQMRFLSSGKTLKTALFGALVRR